MTQSVGRAEDERQQDLLEKRIAAAIRDFEASRINLIVMDIEILRINATDLSVASMIKRHKFAVRRGGKPTV